jgi:hypothetical protein
MLILISDAPFYHVPRVGRRKVGRDSCERGETRKEAVKFVPASWSPEGPE